MAIGLFIIFTEDINFSKYKVELIYSILKGGFCLIRIYLDLDRSKFIFLFFRKKFFLFSKNLTK